MDWVGKLESGEEIKSAFRNFDLIRERFRDLVVPAAVLSGTRRN